MARWALLLILAIASLATSPVRAQFGVPKGVPASIPEDGDGMGGTPPEGVLSAKDAADMEAIIEEAKKDLETKMLVKKMKEQNLESLEELRKLSPEEVLGGMKEALDNMKLIERLFQDKEQAVREMEKEGMIDKAHAKKYRKDPDLLEKDTRRGLYFQFVSLAVVGGFME